MLVKSRGKFVSCINKNVEHTQLIDLIPVIHEATPNTRRNANGEEMSIIENLWNFSRSQLVCAKQRARAFYEESYTSSENEHLLGECYLKIGKFFHQTFDSGLDVVSCHNS